ncbi:MAG: 2-C-methyl-D-erythritol 4-phosphate cytidylyltransferase [Deltaproteobacteria bacterium]|nr:2-C-methyl-D-erythritol 4-phosphate cytidylyltransferase [Deltaproteobacteria bacterium]
MQADIIVVAAGKGERMGRELPKPFLPVGGIPLLIHTLRAITQSTLVATITLVVAPEREELCRDLLRLHGQFRVPLAVVHGGAERQDSVRLGLAALGPTSEIVAIHDAARPFLDREILDRSIETAAIHGGALVAVPARDTIKRVGEEGTVVETIPRQQLWLAQTPQTFRVSLIREAHAQALAEGVVVTDDAALLERLGKVVKIVQGSYRNFKITTPEDLRVAEALLRAG